MYLSSNHTHRIGIIAAGMLRCLGSGLRLKARFGDGIRVSVALALRPVSAVSVPKSSWSVK